MTNHPIVSPDEWLAARVRLLAKEKEFTRQRDQLSEERRALPWVKVQKEYVFDGPNGRETLSQLFRGRSQLLIYHFMYGTDWNEGCKNCSFWADSFDGITAHLKHRDVTMIVVARAVFETERFSEADGLGLQVGVVRQHRFQSRLQRLIYARGDEGNGLLQLRTTQISVERGAGDQRVLQGRRGHDLPYLLVLRPWAGCGERRLSAARPGTEGSQRS